MLFEDVVREGCGDNDGDGEPSRAKRAARASAGIAAVGVDGVMDAERGLLKLTLDLFRAFRRTRRASSVALGFDIARREQIGWRGRVRCAR